MKREREMKEVKQKGRICVTGGTGFLGSWMVKTLLEDGYSVNATIRIAPERERDMSYLTSLPGASERLEIYEADLDKPDSFRAAMEGCAGVFHTAHPMDPNDEEAEGVKTARATTGLEGILRACLDSKTVKRVVYTSSIAAAAFHEAAASVVTDETRWSSVEAVRGLGVVGGSYVVAKTAAERAALEFAEKHGLDVITLLPSWIHGPFLTPACPHSVHLSMALIFGDERCYQGLVRTSLVHVDDVARAHIHLFEYPNAKGRYICSLVESTIHELHEFISANFPQYELPSADSWKDLMAVDFVGFSSKRLLETGFRFQHGLEEMFHGAIESCKQKGIL